MVYFIPDDQDKFYVIDQCFLGVRFNQTAGFQPATISADAG
jgi:hypothetical protein